MAEPISLAAGVIELTNTGFALGKFLNETWLSYKNAPAEVLEIAHEVTICCELMMPLGEQLKTGSVKYNSKFQRAVEGLVANSTRTFDKVRALIPDDGNLNKGILPKWTYVLKKSKIDEHRKKLKKIQQMFLFMKQMMVEAHPARPHYDPSASSMGVSTGSKSTSLPGPSQHFPITLSGQGIDENGHPVTYHATLVMRSSYPSRPAPIISYDPAFPISPRTRDDEERKRLASEKKRLREELTKREALNNKEKSTTTTTTTSMSSPSIRPPSYLKALRQSPFFSEEMLEIAESREDFAFGGERRKSKDDRSRRRSSQKPSRASLEEDKAGEDLEIPDDNEASQDVNQLMASWFGPEEDPPRYPHRPSISVVDTSLPHHQPTSSSPYIYKSPSPPYSPSPSRESTRSPRTSESYFASVDARPTIEYRCDSCQQTIIGSRYQCGSCDDYSLCHKCYNDPEITIRLKHKHPKSRFQLK